MSFNPLSPGFIAEVTPEMALLRQQAGALLLDVREPHERALGAPMNSLGVPLSALLADVAAQAPDKERELLLICASGRRSLQAGSQLSELGYTKLASVSGGCTLWLARGLPFRSSSVLDTDATERYSRHLLLPEVGVGGQTRLNAARVTLIGAGGLGSPSALYLAAAGIGRLRLIDDDRVDRSNLQRQILHTDARVGQAKVSSARESLHALNPRVELELHETRLQAGNVERLLSGSDVVIDGADNFPTRYLLNAACRRLQIPWIYGAVHRFTGQVSVFDPRGEASPCYRCLFPEPPLAHEAPNCAEAGVLGVLPGVIGLLQATEAIKLLLGIGEPLVGRLLTYSALAAGFRELRLPRDAHCPGCGTDATFAGYADIERICASA